MGGFSTTQERILAITPKCGASLSMPCSVFLIYEVWCDHRTRGSTPIQRALVGMSLVDILSSSAWFMSSWVVPEGTWAFAKGNSATCNYQGFLLQLAIGAPLFNASLGLYYALMIRMKWTDKMLAKIELWVHAIIWTFAIGTSVALLPLGQYNQIGQVCWIIGSPVDCGDSTHISNPEVPCERGNHAWLYGIFTFYGPLWICVACCIVCMYLVYLEVRETIVRVRRYSFDVRASRNIGRTEVDAVVIQAILYTVSFFITWMPSTLWSVAHWFRFAAFWLDFLSAFCEPLQGLWNFLIFIRARRRTKKKIKKAFSRLFPFIKFTERDSGSSGASGNGRRNHGASGTQFRTSNFGDSALYRSATLKAMEANASMASQRASSVSFADENSIAMTAPPESSPITMSDDVKEPVIVEEDEGDESSEMSITSEPDRADVLTKDAESFQPQESGHVRVVVTSTKALGDTPEEEGNLRDATPGGSSPASLEAEEETLENTHDAAPMYFL